MVKDVIADLLETPEIQRLYNIKQLGFAHLVFPGAHHTRLEHSLGTFSIAAKIANMLSLDQQETNTIVSAALLHDIGHGPFSHTLESILLENFGVDHIDLTEKLIMGTYDVFEDGERTYIEAHSVSDILEKYDLNKEIIVSLIRGRSSLKPYMSQILNSTIDVDQLNYLIRDAYYTGVAYGMIDIDRLLQTLVVNNDFLTINRKGVHVVENILMARALMYSSVYFHKTVRIAELMLSKAIEHIADPQPFAFFRMTDGEIMHELKKRGDFQAEMVTRLKYRKLFKQAYTAADYELNEEQRQTLAKLEDVHIRREQEQAMEAAFRIPKGHLIIDIPRPELLRTEPRIHQTDIGVLDKEECKSLDDFTPVAQAIRSRIAPDWTVMIITDDRYREIVAKKAPAVLFS